MNEKSKIKLLDTTTGELKEFTGYWSWKEMYQLVKNYEKAKKWKVKYIEIGVNETKEKEDN